ncbi:MAG: hypothetical protein IJY28_01915, partial [Clostridia bacterium]|nr:hypothetical protein [Clostridia bacterium]
MKMLRRKKLLALLLAWTLLLTGCAADPVSSNPSSDMPSSSALSSNPSVSSEPELPPLNLSMPLNGETMLSTICDYGYVDKNGVFHYSPLWYTSYKKSWPAGKQDTQNIADGTPGAKAVYGDLAFGGYILMNDGTLRIASLIEVNDQAITALKQTNIDALYLKTEKSAVPRMYDVFAFDFTEKDGASYVYTANKSLRLDRPAGIVDVIKGLHDTVYLYADGTVDFGYYLDNGDKKSNEVLYPSVNFSAWTNLVQIERISNYMIGLNQEGR